MPQVPFVCSEAKPINSISMVWSGTQAVKIRPGRELPGSTLLATIDNIKPGDEVTVTGYAGSPNDVYWEIFQAGTTNKIGTSTFHLSCSDADMNGSDDCGKYAGDGKGMAGFINDYFAEPHRYKAEAVRNVLELMDQAQAGPNVGTFVECSRVSPFVPEFNVLVAPWSPACCGAAGYPPARGYSSSSAASIGERPVQSASLPGCSTGRDRGDRRVMSSDARSRRPGRQE